MTDLSTRPGADEWLPILECLLRGLAHGLGNRVSAVSALADLSSDPSGLDEDFSLTSLLGNEGVAMRAMLQVVRVLAPDGRPRPDAFVASEAVTDVLEIVQLHADWRDWTMDASAASTQPAHALRVPRWALVHALLVMIDRVTQGHAPAALSLSLTGDDASVSFVVSATHAPGYMPHSARAGACLEGLLPLLNATLHADGASLRLTLPSLAELRRRERA